MHPRFLDALNEAADGCPAPADQSFPEYLRRTTAAVEGAWAAWAIWPEPGAPGGTGTMLIKGGRAARRMARGGRLKGAVAVLRCGHRYAAEALNDVLGDGSTVLSRRSEPPPEVARILGEWAEMKVRLVDEADDHGGQVEAGTLTMEEVFAAHDVVTGHWPDPTEPGGVAIRILKGRGRLMIIAQGKRTVRLKSTGINFRDEAQAVLARSLYGDGRSGT